MNLVPGCSDDKQQELAESTCQEEGTQGQPCPRWGTEYALFPHYGESAILEETENVS